MVQVADVEAAHRLLRAGVVWLERERSRDAVLVVRTTGGQLSPELVNEIAELRRARGQNGPVSVLPGSLTEPMTLSWFEGSNPRFSSRHVARFDYAGQITLRAFEWEIRFYPRVGVLGFLGAGRPVLIRMGGCRLRRLRRLGRLWSIVWR